MDKCASDNDPKGRMRGELELPLRLPAPRPGAGGARVTESQSTTTSLGRRAGRVAAAATVALLLVPAAARAIEMKPEAVQERYRQVLSLLSQGEQEEALESLYALETEALGEYPGAFEIERFWRLKLRVIRELLAGGQLEQLVPIIVFHHDAYNMYRDRGQPLLAAHSRTMSAELAEILAARSDSSAVDGFSAWVLTSLGNYLQESRSVSSSMEFFQRALAIEPENQSALLGMLSALEKNGRYEEASVYGERAIRADPQNHHARLRLANCQRRSGAYGALEKAERNLQVLVERGPRDWIRSVAFQSLAELYFESERAAEGEALLRHAVEELPDDQPIRVMLAAYLDLDRRPKEARAVLAGVRPAAPEQDSPRFIYSKWPSDGIVEARRTMHEMMQSRLTQLATGLRRSPGRGVGR